MKARHSRPSCLNAARTASAAAIAGVVARGLSSGPIVVRRRGGTTKTAAQRATGRRPWRASFAPGRLAAGKTVTLRRETPRLNSTLSDESNTVRPTAERHLLIALLSTEYRRGVFWETAGFLAVWLSGLSGLAICLLWT